MKKTGVILLALLLLTGLCACGMCSHQYTETVTKEATCKEEGIKTFTCEKCEDTYTEAVAKTAHTFTEATCTAPKTCSVCGTTEGAALDHSYTQGKCSGCGEEQAGYKPLTSCGWGTAGLTPDGKELDVITLWFEGEESSVGAGFYEPLDTMDPDFRDEALKHPEDLYDFDGKKYHYMGFGDWRPMSYTEQGDTVVISVWEEEVIGTLTMARTGANQYTVTAITGRIIDETVTSCLSVGSIFTAKG